MKNDLLDKMNLIDPGYIEEAERFEAQKLSVKAKKTVKRLYFEYAALAACLIAGLATGYRALTQRNLELPLGLRQTYSESASTFAESAAPLFMISLVFLLISAALVFLIIKEKNKQSN